MNIERESNQTVRSLHVEPSQCSIHVKLDIGSRVIEHRSKDFLQTENRSPVVQMKNSGGFYSPDMTSRSRSTTSRSERKMSLHSPATTPRSERKTSLHSPTPERKNSRGSPLIRTKNGDRGSPAPFVRMKNDGGFYSPDITHRCEGYRQFGTHQPVEWGQTQGAQERRKSTTATVKRNTRKTSCP